MTINERLDTIGIHTAAELAARFDHTILGATTPESEIDRSCEEAIRFGFKNVCVNPYYVVRAARKTAGTGVGICVATGFPLGQNTTAVKVAEALRAREDGAAEIDMVLNVAAIKNEVFQYVSDEVAAVVAASAPLPVKVVLETAYLSHREIVLVCEICQKAGAQWVKTSTGTVKPGATVEVVSLMYRTVHSSMGIKASGGVRSLEDATMMFEAGAGRLGSSSGVSIMEEYNKNK